MFAVEGCCRIVNCIGTNRVNADRRSREAGDCVGQKHGADMLPTKGKVTAKPADQYGGNAGVARQLSSNISRHFGQRNTVRGQGVTES